MSSIYTERIIDDRLNHLVDILLLNSSFVKSLGLLNGKMGISIFFFHYARYTGNLLFEKYAGELIDDISRGIHEVNSIDFANGLTGIGWGLEYLVKQGFLDADTDEMLEEMDTIIYRKKMQLPILIKSSNDLFGNGLYYLARLKSNLKEDDNLKELMKKHHLIFLTDECERLLIHKRYLDFNILYLSNETIKSLCFFLLEMFRLELFPEKVGRLLKYLPLYIEYKEPNKDDLFEAIGISQFIKYIIPCLKDSDLQKQFLTISEVWDKKLSENEPDIEAAIRIFTRTAWQQMIYSPYSEISNDLSTYTKKAYEYIENEENWNIMIRNRNLNNLSLKGFAGLGLRFVNDRINN